MGPLPEFTTGSQRSAWARLRGELPLLPIGEENGRRFLQPAAEILGPLRTMENPELYAVLPFQIWGVGRPGLEVARATFERRRVKNTGGWQQNAIQAACLGLTETAASFAARNLTPPPRQPLSRFLGSQPRDGSALC